MFVSFAKKKYVNLIMPKKKIILRFCFFVRLYKPLFSNVPDAAFRFFVRTTFSLLYYFLFSYGTGFSFSNHRFCNFDTFFIEKSRPIYNFYTLEPFSFRKLLLVWSNRRFKRTNKSFPYLLSLPNLREGQNGNNNDNNTSWWAREQPYYNSNAVN